MQARRLEFPEPVSRVDAIGCLCPVPVTRTAARMREIRAGETLELLADDRMVLVDVPSWCYGWRHEYLGHREVGGILHLYLRKASERER